MQFGAGVGRILHIIIIITHEWSRCIRVICFVGLQLASYIYKLKYADQKYRSLVVAHDMTKTEREECQKPLTDAKTGKSGYLGGIHVHVRGLPGEVKIVKLWKRYLLKPQRYWIDFYIQTQMG